MTRRLRHGGDGFIYRNDLVEYAHARWGRIRSLDGFLDTQAVAELDEHLTSAGEAPPAA